MNKIMELLKDIEEKAKELQTMIEEPASKEWFEHSGSLKIIEVPKYPDSFKSESEQIISEDLKN